MIPCKSCNATIYWGKTPAGKPCPFDDEACTISHFTTCPNALPPRQQAVIEALSDAGFEYIGIDDENEATEDTIWLGGFGISERYFINGYWIAVESVETLDTWSYPLEKVKNFMSIEEVVQIIKEAIEAYDTKDQLSLPLPAPVPPIPTMPADAFTVTGASGWFAVTEDDFGFLVSRWKDKKKGRGKNQTIYTELTRHHIGNITGCDCKQAEFKKVCSHQKALQTYQDKLSHAKWLADYKAKEAAEMLERNRYKVQFWGQNSSEPQDCGVHFGELKFAVQQMEKLVFTRQATRAEIIDRVEREVVDCYPKEKRA